MRLQVKVAVFVEEGANHRKELVYKIVSPPFHPMPLVGPGGGVTHDDHRPAEGTGAGVAAGVASGASGAVRENAAAAASLKPDGVDTSTHDSDDKGKDLSNSARKKKKQAAKRALAKQQSDAELSGSVAVENSSVVKRQRL